MGLDWGCVDCGAAWTVDWTGAAWTVGLDWGCMDCGLDWGCMDCGAAWTVDWTGAAWTVGWTGAAWTVDWTGAAWTVGWTGAAWTVGLDWGWNSGREYWSTIPFYVLQLSVLGCAESLVAWQPRISSKSWVGHAWYRIMAISWTAQSSVQLRLPVFIRWQIEV